jgi:hypothetical protein
VRHRIVLTLGLVALAAALLPISAQAGSAPTALLELRTPGVVVTHGFHDRILHHPSLRARAAAASGTDLTLTTPDGIPVGVTISDRYGPTPTAEQAAQNTVNFLATRVHSSELGLLRVYIGPPDEISSICGAQEALACYAPDEQRMYVPGEEPPNSPVPVEYIITHEYGHHIANHRRNALGPAFTLGPEYWATSQFICAGVLSKPPAFFPGDEGDHYIENPGEGWADSYAHLPENGFQSAPFQFSPLFHRDAAAFAAIRRDVLQPWTGLTSRTVRGSLGAGRGDERFRLVVSLDGPVVGRLRGPSGSDFDLQVRLGGKTVDSTHRPGSRDRVAGTLCGTPRQPPPNRLLFVVVRRSGSGPFTLTLTEAG